MMNEYITIRDLCEARRHIGRFESPVVFVVEEGNVNFCGRVIDETFGYQVGNQQASVGRMIRDFKSYESGQGRTPLVFVFEGISIPSAVCDDDTQDGWVVHATDTEAGASILKMRRLCSRHYLRLTGTAFRPFGRQELGEPADYSDLVNFAPLDRCGAEVVVASKQHEKFCSETDLYTPGMRFYFSVPSLAVHANYVAFLGGHAIRGFVVLDEVDHCVVTAAELGKNVAWTPKTFSEAADALFEEKISNQGVQATW